MSWHGARLTFLALFLVALFRVETVNLDKLASVFANRAQSASNHKRLTRFFRQFVIDFDEIAQAVVSWSQIPPPW
ncbi:MAG: IS4 family transposase, partial [Cyanobacteria bacterium P01_H01_bin.152]